MTRKEAIAILQTMEYELSNQVGSTYCRKKYDAVRVAIKALEQETVSKESYDHEYFLRKEFEIKIARLEHDKNVVLDKIRAEIHATAEMHEDGDYYLRDEWIDEYFDKYKAESEEV